MYYINHFQYATLNYVQSFSLLVYLFTEVFFRSVHCSAEYVGQLLTGSKKRKRSLASRFSLSVEDSLVKYLTAMYLTARG